MAPPNSVGRSSRESGTVMAKNIPSSPEKGLLQQPVARLQVPHILWTTCPMPFVERGVMTPLAPHS